ncbi:MAG TPA: hypothetical protein VN659_12250 [Pyrinomonadaceae bacterium]|jgi:hypothetical protein|nr:hypothetical protein [Pyrinomonadaceae bacterium]
MADDRMRNDDDLQNMGGGAKDQDYGQQSPGRTGQGGKQGGQHAGGYGGSQQKSNYGSGQNERDMEDDDVGAANNQQGGMGRGGQNR